MVKVNHSFINKFIWYSMKLYDHEWALILPHQPTALLKNDPMFNMIKKIIHCTVIYFTMIVIWYTIIMSVGGLDIQRMEHSFPSTVVVLFMRFGDEIRSVCFVGENIFDLES